MALFCDLQKQTWAATSPVLHVEARRWRHGWSVGKAGPGLPVLGITENTSPRKEGTGRVSFYIGSFWQASRVVMATEHTIIL